MMPAAPRRATVLLTGFGPFPQVPANASAMLVPRLAEYAERELPGIDVAWRVLPTEWQVAPRMLSETVGAMAPNVVLHFGVAPSATGFVIEARGRNSADQLADAAGCMPEHDCVDPAGPEFLSTTLRPDHLVARLRRRGLPAMISRDAGGYLCNALLYTSLGLARAGAHDFRSGFVHLPADLVQPLRPERGPGPRCRLTWDETIDGGLELISAALGRPPRPLGHRPRPWSWRSPLGRADC